MNRDLDGGLTVTCGVSSDSPALKKDMTMIRSRRQLNTFLTLFTAYSLLNSWKFKYIFIKTVTFEILLCVKRDLCGQMILAQSQKMSASKAELPVS